MIVSACSPLGDATCPHCGSLLYPELNRDSIHSEAEKRLSNLGVLIETNDEGEITIAQLNGPQFKDEIIHKLAMLNSIPLIKLCRTGLSQQGIEKLRQLLSNSVVEEIS